MKRIVLFVMILALFSCRAETYEEVTVDCMPAADTVIMNQTYIDRDILMPLRIFVADGMLVVCQDKSEHLFTVFRLPLDGYGTAAGYAGRGPDEFVHIDVRSITPCSGGFRAADAAGVIKRIRIDSVGLSVKVVEKVPVPVNKEIPNGLVELADYCLNYNLNDEIYEYVRYDKETWERVPVCEYPKWENDDEGLNIFRYMKNIAVHPSGSRFAACYAYYPKIRILDQTGKIEKEISIDCGDSGRDIADGNPKLAYHSFPSACEDYFAEIFSGENIGEDRKRETELHVWSWSGILLHRILFDRTFSLFCIDDATGILYAMNEETPDVIYSADLFSCLHDK